MYGLGVNRLGVTNTYDTFEWEPINLFANSEQGAWYDPSDLSTVFQQDGTTATIPWTSGDILDVNRVGKLVDKSGNGNDLFQTTLSKCAVLKYVGGLYYLEFDGIDDGYQTASTVDFTGTNSVSVFTGARKEADASEIVVELSSNVGSNTGAFKVGPVGGDVWRWTTRGNLTVNANASGYVPPVTSVVTGLSDSATDYSAIRVDGVEEQVKTNDQGTIGYGDYELNVGAKNNASGSFLEGRIYSLVVRGVLSNASDIAEAEAYVAAKTGVTI